MPIDTIQLRNMEGSSNGVGAELIEAERLTSEVQGR